jgi:hypothetical protein
VRLPRSLIIAAMLLASINLALPDNLTGQASVIDGYTLDIHGTRVGL